MNKDKTGIFGGSFNPIHFGHLRTAEYLYNKRNYTELIFVPNYVSPHKIFSESAISKTDILNMLKIALVSYPMFTISEIELKREGISYTIDTLKELEHDKNNLELIIGYDNYLVFDKWKDPGEIFNYADVIVMQRPGSSGRLQNINKFTDEFIFEDTPLIDISSTEIRERIKCGLDVSEMLPKAVIEYIADNKLYL